VPLFDQWSTPNCGATTAPPYATFAVPRHQHQLSTATSVAMKAASDAKPSGKNSERRLSPPFTALVSAGQQAFRTCGIY